MRVIPHSYGQIQSGVCGRSYAHTSRTHAPVSISLSREGMENMRASPLEYVSMGPLYNPVPHHTSCCSPGSPLFVPPAPSSDSYFPRLPPPVYRVQRDPTVHYPTLSFSPCVWSRPWSLPLYRRSCERSCIVRVRVDTARARGRGREGEGGRIHRECVCLPPVFNSKERSARME